MADWIPRNEEDFDNLATQFCNGVGTDPAAYGLSAGDGTALTTALEDWQTAFGAGKTLDAQKKANTQDKITTRDALTALMRTDGARIQPNPAVSNAQRETVGLPVHKDSRTPAPVPTTAPVLSINSARRLEHVISWRDAASPFSKARPQGVAGLALYLKIGAPAPVSIQECRRLGMITRSPNLEEFDPADGGKVAYYIGQWVNTTGEHGPLSEVAAATIAAQT